MRKITLLKKITDEDSIDMKPVLTIHNELLYSCSYMISGEDGIHNLLIDCGETDPIRQYVCNSSRTNIDVLLTHAHFDHIYGLNELCVLFPMVKVYTNEYGRDMLLNSKKNMSFYHEKPFIFMYPENIVTVKDGDELICGDNLIAKAVFTSGHNPSCITWLIDDSVFTGDSYIPGIKTVTNLPGGNKIEAEQSIKLIKDISSGKKIYPGHKL